MRDSRAGSRRNTLFIINLQSFPLKGYRELINYKPIYIQVVNFHRECFVNNLISQIGILNYSSEGMVGVINTCAEGYSYIYIFTESSKHYNKSWL